MEVVMQTENAFGPTILAFRRTFVGVQVARLLMLLPEQVSARYADKHPELSRTEVQARHCEMVRFLFVAATHEGYLTPSPVVDEVWHNFVLFTKLYAPWCNEHLLGVIVHHDPCIGLRSTEEAASSLQTAELMQSLGGDSEFWPVVMSEHPCGSSTCKKLV